MPIPLSQLNTWSHQGATASSSAAYNAIRHSLTKNGAPTATLGLNIYLQGSYGNDTNIYGDSDVDVVVLFENTFHKDMSAWTPQQQALHEQVYRTADYQWAHLKRDVLASLRQHFGNGSVTEGSKSIKVQTSHTGRPSDVIPALQFRRYGPFTDINNPSAHWGIQFFDSSNNPIVNYPKYHIDRGVEKNQAERTSGRYKCVVRIFKNLRNHMVASGLLPEGAAPSYFLECMLFNVPDDLFKLPFDQAVPAIIAHLRATSPTGWLCQNGVTNFIGTDGTQWTAAKYAAFHSAAQTAWERWYSR